MNKYAFLFCFILLSCSAEQTTVSGIRKSVLNHDVTLIADVELKEKILPPKPEKVTRWKQNGGFSHHVMQNPNLPAIITPIWKTRIGEGIDKKSFTNADPVGLDDKIYVIDAKGKVSSLYAKNGKGWWSKKVIDDHTAEKLSIVSSGLAIDNGILFITLGTGEVVALNSQNGNEIWRTNVGSPVRSAPTVYGGRLFILTADNNLKALSQQTGEELWKLPSFINNISILGKASPAIDNGIGISVFSSGDIIAFRPDTGSILWTSSLVLNKFNPTSNEITDIKARPIIWKNRAYAISVAGKLVCLDMEKDGEENWHLEIAGIHQPWLAGDVLYVLTLNSELIAINAEKGNILWINELEKFNDPVEKKEPIFWNGPIMAGSRLFLTNSNGKIFSFNIQTGELFGKIDLNTKFGTLSPIVLNDILYVQTLDGYLIAFSDLSEKK